MALSTWIARSTKAGGEYNTPTVTIPAGIDEVHVVLYLQNNTDFSDTSLAVTARVEVSMDNAASWQTVAEFGWRGGALPTPPPGKEAVWEGRISGIDAYAGGMARAHISSSGNFRWGIRGEVIRGG